MLASSISKLEEEDVYIKIQHLWEPISRYNKMTKIVWRTMSQMWFRRKIQIYLIVEIFMNVTIKIP